MPAEKESISSIILYIHREIHLHVELNDGRQAPHSTNAEPKHAGSGRVPGGASWCPAVIYNTLTISWPPVLSTAFARPAFSPIRRRVASAHQNRISNSPTRQPSQPHRPETTLICVRPPTIGTHIQDEDLRRHILGPEDLPWKGTMNSSPRTVGDGWEPSETAKRRNDRTKRSRVAGSQARLVFATAMKERALEEIRRKKDIW